MKMLGQQTNNFPHRRKNILTDEWVLVSPHRTKRPWQGEISETGKNKRPEYVADCYLCPGNRRANGEINPDYKSTFVFTNDFSALIEDIPETNGNHSGLLKFKSEKGLCRVVNFSPKHNLTLAEMKVKDIEKVVETWQKEFYTLSVKRNINYIQIFENKGSIMGNSNPHPHCQIWAQQSIPVEPAKELKQFRKYYKKTEKSLLSDYVKIELKLDQRIVFKNDSFIALVPFWAVWPYELLIVSKRKIPNILKFTKKETTEFAQILKAVTTKYDNLFNVSFPYSAGLHQAPTDGKEYREWHFHMHFYPPLLRSASIKKFMVGYEMLAEPQRDITPEQSAKVLKDLSTIHNKFSGKN